MKRQRGNDGSSDPDVTYFKEFIDRIEREYPYASWLLIMEEIQFARAVGPIEAQLLPSQEGVYELIIPIGFGHKALIELEWDRSGMLWPVMGGIIKE
jgi:hypothetical protein